MVTKTKSLKDYTPDAKNRVQVPIKLSLINDIDIIEWLDKQPSTQSYIKRIIRKDMVRQEVLAEMNIQESE